MKQSRPSETEYINESLDSSRRVTNVVALFAIFLFALVGSEVVPGALGLAESEVSAKSGLVAAFLLNIALLIFAWRRSSELRLACNARDVAEKRARDLACKDETTGLFNRRFLIERIRSLCHSETEMTLLLLDLDHFKKVNDLYGHAVGDALLAEAAARIWKACPKDACCARLGGDEFAILVHGQNARRREASILAEDLLKELKRPIRFDGKIAIVGASIGLSFCEDGGERPEALLRRSDIAMYHAKTLGRDCFAWFDAEMEEEQKRRNALEGEIREGLTAGRFVPYFQPLVDLHTGEIKGLEVLARWDHPIRGIVEPREFIPIAEATGLISELSITVMRDALSIARDWPDHLTVAVNVSPVQFKDPLLDQRIIKVLAETGFPAGRLELEVTENMMLDDQQRAISTVESLKNQGIRISLDDFGTGYCSLSQLRVLPFDRIKIDRSFVASLLDDTQSSAIVHAITTLGKTLDLPITAEGVETEEEYRRLHEFGCADAQGWLFGKAVSAEETARMIIAQAEAAASREAEQVQSAEIAPPEENCDYPKRASGG